jgi:hypothetical protein
MYGWVVSKFGGFFEEIWVVYIFLERLGIDM